MATRLLIQLGEPEKASGRLPDGVMALLQSAGAKQIRASHPELPGLFTAIVPDETSLDALLASLKSAPGVRHVERDAMRFTL